jgi:tetratricopeptide (TPR) repeat protein
MGRAEDAEIVYRRIIEQAANFVPARLGLASLLSQRGAHKEALVHLEAAASTRPKDAEVQIRLATAHRQMHDLKGAEKIYRAVLDREPNRVAALLGIGQVAWESGRRSDALRYYQAAVAVDPIETRSKSRLASALLAERHFGEAEPLFQSVLAAKPGDVGALVGLGQVAAQRREFDAARGYFEVAVAGEPRNITARMGLARSFQDLSHPAEAEVIFKQVVEQSPDYVPARLALGTLLRERGERDAALAQFSAAADRSPDNPAAQIAKAQTLRELRDFDGAQAIYESVLAQDPKNVVALLGIGQVAWDRGQRSDALRHFQAAVALDPIETRSKLRLSNALLEERRLEEAESLLQSILAAKPGDVAALACLGHVALQRRDFDAARGHFEAAAAKDPQNIMVRMGLARSFQDLSLLAEAEVIYRQIIGQFPDHIQARFALGNLLRERGERDAALEQFNAVADRSPGNPTAQIAKAQTLRELLDFDSARAVYESILAQDPNNFEALRGIGQVAWDRGQRSVAVTHFHAAAALKPDDPQINLQLGRVLLEHWQLDEAEALFRRVIAAESNNASAILALGEVAALRGNEEEAMARFRAAAALEPDNQVIQREIRHLQPNYAVYDWRQEVSDAIAILRDANSKPRDRIVAATTLLEHGVTDLLPATLAPLAPKILWVRRLLQVVHQLDRLKLSQTSVSYDLNPDRDQDQLNAMSGCVERLSPGADTLVLVFCGRLHRMFLSIHLLHMILRTTRVSVVYVRDLERTRFMGGVVGLGNDFATTVDAFEHLKERSGARRLLTIGQCIGCGGALRYGLALKAEAVLGIGPRMGPTTLEGLVPQIAARLAALRAATPDLARDVPSLYRAAAAAPRVTLIAGNDVEPDASVARDMAARVPGVVFAGINGGSHDCLSDLLARRLLSPLLSGFVADGQIAPEILDAMGRDAPESFSPPGESDPHPMQVAQ